MVRVVQYTLSRLLSTPKKPRALLDKLWFFQQIESQAESLGEERNESQIESQTATQIREGVRPK